MSEYQFSLPVQIRYADIDAQGHVNNARYVAFIELARFQYLLTLGLWDGNDFLELGLIVADTHVSYLLPIKLKNQIKVGVKVEKMGNKSMLFVYMIEDVNNNLIYAKAETVMVTYDYQTERTIPIPARWRELISSFEGREYPR